jgi:hypothetical protein
VGGGLPAPGWKGRDAAFFTTLDLKPKRILALYRLRWNIETDLRSLKRTLELHQVTCKTKDIVEKDVTMAVCAYNVVRAVISLSASKAGLRPRQLSFSTAQDAVMAAWPYLQRARAMAEFHEENGTIVAGSSPGQTARALSEAFVSARDLGAAGDIFPSVALQPKRCADSHSDVRPSKVRLHNLGGSGLRCPSRDVAIGFS